MTEANPRTRVGIIGYGLAGRRIHAPLLEAAGGYEVRYVASRSIHSDPDRRDNPRFVTDPHAVIGSDEVDLVVVASPNETHFEYAAAALIAGKAVVVDKPMALRKQDADALQELARANSGILTVFQNRRLDASFQLVQEIVRGGSLGEVMLTECHWDRFRAAGAALLAPTASKTWDLAPHMVDQALQLFGLPDGVTADIECQDPSSATDDYFQITLRYGSRRCILSASNQVADPRARFSVHGARGSLTVPFYEPHQKPIGEGRHPADRDYFAGVSACHAQMIVDGVRQSITVEPRSWTDFYRQLSRALAGLEAPSVKPAEASLTTHIIELAFSSASQGSRVIATNPEQTSGVDIICR